MKRLVVTGGAGFAGSHICLAAKAAWLDCEVIAFDNLLRRGSEENLARLAAGGVRFVHGDVRQTQDLEALGRFDALVEASAEPSVLAGSGGGGPGYVIATNLGGALNCAEACRRHGAHLVFLSSSRVYGVEALRACSLKESPSRLAFAALQSQPGVSAAGIASNFSTSGSKSYYGASKFAAEQVLAEYAHAGAFPVDCIRFGVLAGPWQFGRADQGILTWWLLNHIFKRPLRYIGWGGSGRQVRDFLHADDMAELVLRLLASPGLLQNRALNAGGGLANSASLAELTAWCRELCGEGPEIGSDPANRYADIPCFVADNQEISALSGWLPRKNLAAILSDAYNWMKTSPGLLDKLSRL
ncbi:MAG: hypothetical protein RL095_1634 [Verrucomicrobiota bacterium]|jgi:CDP-paratose 2-epimerase